jgi:glutamine synthetase
MHLSLFRNDKNAFAEEKGSLQLSKTALQFIAGLLEHADEMVAITNPLVNSFKRLTPGYEAPTNVAWSASNRSAMVRVPAKRGQSTRCELRIPDPSCNPYLALTVMLAAGMSGMAQNLTPPPPIQRNIYQMSVRDRRKHKVKELPGTLREALQIMKRSRVVKNALGEHIFDHFIDAKTLEFDKYRETVHQWELEQYLAEY